MRKLFFILFLVNFLRINSQVIYTDLNPDYFIYGSGLSSTTTKSLDIDNDGINDFDVVRNQNYATVDFYLVPKNNNKIVCVGNMVDTLNVNDLISQSSNFCSTTLTLSNYNYGTSSGSGLWRNAINKFIGIAFNTSTGLKYGWIRMADVNTIASYGYNSISNQSIFAGEGVINVAEYVLLSDIGNNGNGRDLRVKFNKALLENKLNDYRILIVPTAKVANFTIDSAKQVSLVNSFSVPAINKNIDTTLNQLSKDVYGNLIKSLVSYNAIVVSYPNLSISSDTLISLVSNPTILYYPNLAVSQPTVLSTLVSAYNYNINVNFTPPASETGILHYRLYFLEDKDSVRFNLDTANGVPLGNYQVIVPTGSVQNLNYSNASILTYKGQPLSALTKYKVKIMAYTDSVNTNYSSISLASNSFTVYTQVESVKNIIVEDIADSHSISDIKIYFNKAVNETNLSEYRAIVVPKVDYNSFGLDSASSTLHYVSLISNGLNQTLILPSNLKDFKGNNILESSTYYLYVLSINNGITSDVSALSLLPKYFAFNTLNYFTAGQTEGVNVKHYDIKDTSIAASYNTSASYFLDVDSNGVNDIKLTCSHSGSQVGNSISIVATMLNGTEMSCFKNTNLLLPHDSLDMLYIDLSWKTGSSYLSYLNTQNVPQPIITSSGGLWDNISQKYMAIRLIGQDTSYAWIKISANASSAIVYSYGLLNKNILGIKELKSNSLNIWPVPASENIYINEIVKDISVYNNLGELVLRKFNTNLIDVSQLMSGIYIVMIQTDKGFFQKKVVICR